MGVLPWAAWFRGVSGGCWVPRAKAEELHTSALDGLVVPCGAFRIFFIAGFGGDAKVVGRVGVDDHTEGAEFLGSFDFETTEDATIFSNYDGPFDGDVVGEEGIVVGECAVVCEDEGASDVPTERVRLAWEYGIGAEGV